MEKLFQRWYDLISIDSVSGHEVGAADYVAQAQRAILIKKSNRTLINF